MQPRTTNLDLERRGFRSLPVQLKYAVLLTIVVATTSLATIFVMSWFIQRNYNLIIGDELGISAQVIEVVRKEQRLLETSLLVMFLFSIATAFMASLYVTRKLTGPIVALQRQLWLFSRGDWSRDFRLRQKDEFKELESIVNQLRENRLKQKDSAKVPWQL